MEFIVFFNFQLACQVKLFQNYDLEYLFIEIEL